MHRLRQTTAIQRLIHKKNALFHIKGTRRVSFGKQAGVVREPYKHGSGAIQRVWFSWEKANERRHRHIARYTYAAGYEVSGVSAEEREKEETGKAVIWRCPFASTTRSATRPTVPDTNSDRFQGKGATPWERKPHCMPHTWMWAGKRRRCSPSYTSPEH